MRAAVQFKTQKKKKRECTVRIPAKTKKKVYSIEKETLTGDNSTRLEYVDWCWHPHARDLVILFSEPIIKKCETKLQKFKRFGKGIEWGPLCYVTYHHELTVIKGKTYRIANWKATLQSRLNMNELPSSFPPSNFWPVGYVVVEPREQCASYALYFSKY